MKPRTGLLLLTAAVLAGCSRPPQPPAIGCYLGSRRDLAKIDRVVFVELSDPKGNPTVVEGLTRELSRALSERKLFHVDVVDRSDPLCRDLPLQRREAYTLAQLARMREELRCDAVLFGSVTHFQPHPRMQAGLYLRLLDLRDGKLIWGIDHIWDTTDKQLELRAKDFWNERMRDGYAPATWTLIMKSPRAFQKFVAYEAAKTFEGFPPPGSDLPRPDPRKIQKWAENQGLVLKE